jgi:hypothetical protein
LESPAFEFLIAAHIYKQAEYKRFNDENCNPIDEFRIGNNRDRFEAALQSSIAPHRRRYSFLPQLELTVESADNLLRPRTSICLRDNYTHYG